MTSRRSRCRVHSDPGSAGRDRRPGPSSSGSSSPSPSVALGGAAFVGRDASTSNTVPSGTRRMRAAWAGLTTRFAGAAACTSCHARRRPGAQDASIHVDVSCEGCHGPAAAHSASAGGRAARLARRADRARSAPPATPRPPGRPASFPQIDQARHYSGGQCLRCHDPHSIVAVRPPTVSHPLANLPACTTCHAPDGLKRIPTGHEVVEDRVCLSCHGPPLMGSPDERAPLERPRRPRPGRPSASATGGSRAGRCSASASVAAAVPRRLHPALRLAARPRPRPADRERRADRGAATTRRPIAGASSSNTNTCIGCGLCVVACKDENHVPMDPEYSRTWVERHTRTADGTVHVDSPDGGIDGFDAGDGAGRRSPAPGSRTCASCLACACSARTRRARPSVRSGRPTGRPTASSSSTRSAASAAATASWPARTARATSCRPAATRRGAWPASPTSARSATTGSRPAGGRPAWRPVPVGARTFGDLNDPTSAVSVTLRETPTTVLKAGLGTKPRVHYVGLEGEVDA